MPLNPIPSRHGPGAVIVPRGSQSRYGQFEMDLERLWVPGKTLYVPVYDANPAKARNEGIRLALKSPDGVAEAEWFFFLDDDHGVPPSTLIQLLDRDLPVVSAFVCSKRVPFQPVVFKERKDDPITHKLRFLPYQWEDFDGVRGVFQVPEGGAIGAAALLVRREALVKVYEPWFRLGQYDAEELHEDIWFVDQLQSEHVPIYVDLDAPIAHIDGVGASPFQLSDGRWTVSLGWGTGRINLGRS